MAWSGGARQTEAWWSRNAPLRLRLVILVGIAMLPPGLLAFWQASAGYQSALTQLQNSLEQSAKLAASEQEHVIAAARELLTSAMTQAPARTGKALCSPALEHVLANRAAQFFGRGVERFGFACEIVFASGAPSDQGCRYKGGR